MKRSLFSRFAKWTASQSGKPRTFGLACLIVLVWVVTGPIFDYSDTWQLVINTGTTIITFLMVFVIQHTQNQDTTAMHLKLAELIRAIEGAHNVIMNLEELEEEELEAIHKRYSNLATSARESLRKGEPDTNKPDVTELFNLK